MLAFIMAAILASAFTYVVFRRMRDAQRPVTQLVAAAKDLPAGVALSANDVTMVDWPNEVVLPGSFTKKEDVLGHPLIQSVGAKEPILKRTLGLEGSGIGLSTKIPPGMRATAVKSNEIVGVAGFLYPGSHVDVMVTLNVPGAGGVSGTLTQTVLQDVEVLTAGQTIEPDPQGKPQQVNVVTLLLSPENSQKLQLASTQGSIQFVLRNGTDKTTAELRPTRVEQLGAVAPPSPSSATKSNKPAKRAAKPAPAVYVLEVIQGTQKTVHKFDEANKETG